MITRKQIYRSTVPLAAAVKPVCGRLNSGIVGDLLAICFHTGIWLSLFCYPENGGDMFLRNVWFTFNGVHGVIS
jgi:hypothetical protein